MRRAASGFRPENQLVLIHLTSIDRNPSTKFTHTTLTNPLYSPSLVSFTLSSILAVTCLLFYDAFSFFDWPKGRYIE